MVTTLLAGTVDATGLPADLATVDALARRARVVHGGLRLHGAQRGLRELIGLCGLEEVLRSHRALTCPHSAPGRVDGMPELDDVTKRRIDDLVDEIVAQFGGTVERPAVAELMNDSIGRLAESAAIPDYLVPLAGRLTRERLRARRHGMEHVDGDTKHVVFVSLSGGGRGQLAAALTRRLSGGRVEVYSAGTAAHGEVDPSVAAVLAELGVEESEAFARPITPEVLAGVDLVVTMGHSVGVFEIPEGTAHEDWRVGDPADAPVEEVRRVSDDIERRVRRLLERLGVPAAAER